MDQVNLRIGPVAFDHADYDAENDVLYLHVGEPRGAEGEETPEGHVLRFEPGTQQIVGLTVLGAFQGIFRATQDNLRPARLGANFGRYICVYGYRHA